MAALLRSLVRGLARSLGWREPRREPEPIPEVDPYVVSLVVAGGSRHGVTYGSSPFTVIDGGADTDPDYSYLYGPADSVPPSR